jgi:hypothetical protein
MRIYLLTGVLLAAGFQLKAQAVRCATASRIEAPQTSSGDLTTRNLRHFGLVFHILYRDSSEHLPDARIIGQVQVLNEVFNSPGAISQHIPGEFRKLKSPAPFHFCLASRDPNGNPTTGILRKATGDPGIACRRENGRRSLMSSSLGGEDLWDPTRYINIYVVNRDRCPAPGEAIFPWDANAEEDGIILDLRAVGYSGNTGENSPYLLGLTLVHELGHYFGLLHLSANLRDCTGDDLVDDTPAQGREYFGCPGGLQFSCGSSDMYMNYMSLVDDNCMQLFTIGQVDRMLSVIEDYRPMLASQCLQLEPGGAFDRIGWAYDGAYWLLSGEEGTCWQAQVDLFDSTGKLLWQAPADCYGRLLIPDPHSGIPGGIYYAKIYNDQHLRTLKLINR